MPERPAGARLAAKPRQRQRPGMLNRVPPGRGVAVPGVERQPLYAWGRPSARGGSTLRPIMGKPRASSQSRRGFLKTAAASAIVAASAPPGAGGAAVLAGQAAGPGAGSTPPEGGEALTTL